MTDAERVAKVPWQRRVKIHAMRTKGQYVTHIAAQLGMTKATVAAVIEAMVKREEQIRRQKHAPCPKEQWHQPQSPGWRVHGEIRR